MIREQCYYNLYNLSAPEFSSTNIPHDSYPVPFHNFNSHSFISSSHNFVV